MGPAVRLERLPPPPLHSACSLSVFLSASTKTRSVLDMGGRGVWVNLWICLLVQMTVLVTPSYSVGLGDACTENANCAAVQNAVCGSGGVCECDSTHYRSGAVCLQRISPGQQCIQGGPSNQCRAGSTCTNTGTSVYQYKINREQSCSGYPDDCVAGAECNNNVCKIRAGGSCTGVSDPNCQAGSQCVSTSPNFSCKITAGSSLNCNGDSGQCVPTAICETQRCKIRVNEDCSSPDNCQTGTTCVDVTGSSKQCRRNYGSPCTTSTECQNTNHQDCISAASPSPGLRCLCAANYFRSTTGSCQTDYTTTSYTIDGLLSYWQYQVSVFPQTPVGPALSTTQTQTTVATEPEAVNFTLTQKEDSGNTLVLTVFCLAEKDRHGYITSFVYSSEVTAAGVDTRQGPPSGTIPVDNGACQGSKTREVKVAAETGYNFTVFARSQDYEGMKSWRQITMEAKPPKLNPPAGFDLVGTGPTTSTTFSLELCSCVVSEDQGHITLAGIIVCEPSGSDLCDPAGGQQNESYYRALPTWRQFMEGRQGSPRVNRYRPTADSFGDLLKRGPRKRRAVQNGVLYTIGDNNTCDQLGDDVYCNGPLPEDTTFYVIVWACTSAGCVQSDQSVTATTQPASSLDDGGGVSVGAFVGAVIAVLVVVAIVAGGIVLYKRRSRKGSGDSGNDLRPSSQPKFISPKTPNTGNVSVPSRHTTARSGDSGNDLRPSSQPKFISPKTPNTGNVSVPSRHTTARAVKLRDFSARLLHLHKDSDFLFQQEYEELQNNSPHYPQEVAMKERNRTKNRFVNILPYDHSRVKLSRGNGVDTSDYINASFVPGYTSPKEYIATQSPLHATVPDFWRMVWEHKSSLIVMIGNAMPTVDMYWPGELRVPVQYGDTGIVVEMTYKSALLHHTVRTFHLCLANRGDKTRRVTHCFLPGWDGASTPDWLGCVDAVSQETRGLQGPIIVHCNAGVGNTSVFIALDYLVQFVRNHSLEEEVDVYSLVLNMRHNRPFMVQTERQYMFIHEALKVLIDRKMERMLHGDNAYINTGVYDNPAFGTEEENGYSTLAPYATIKD